MIFFTKKSLFVFWSSQKNVPEPDCQKWARNSILVENAIFLLYPENLKSFFSHKKPLFVYWPCQKKCHFWPKLSFWPIFGNLAQWHFFDLARKQKVIFFTKESLLIYWSTFFGGRKNRLQYYTKTTFEIFVAGVWKVDLNEGGFWLPWVYTLTWQ